MVTATYQAANPSKATQEYNFGINGQSYDYVYPVAPSNSFGNLTADATTRVDPVLNDQGTKYLVIFAGTNGIHLKRNSGATEAALALAYVDARIAAGWTAANICLVTMLPRQGQYESERTAFNTALRAGATARGVKLADLDTTALGAAGAEFNSALYQDLIHPTAAGHVTIASVITAALFP